ncbi:MAG: TIGR04211 family SH3 domain-containing protein [Deltaproteobacteria bacterium]|nr:TIGR04211 family SH3 domain-containing protein [Deltaproteobacteria bacterium]MBW2597811.1 TIGR04211 family SH3 domain-containing protein [Deltaproteobacteria bacterium]MBW2639186.1 TIGR04211 family SH3 domain-containing protein [Deltaproteobacteria bacterium]MBW2680670.1 TIGR04211 family SH3 domain-containing protein [Deltaproteobacteria bacterium]
MKNMCIIGMCLVLFSTPVLAENKYVSDSVKVTMRTGPGNDRKIISLLRVGTKVEVVQPGDDWTLVRLANEKEGWVINRFLTDKIPSDIELKILKSKYQALKDSASQMQEKNSLLKAENKKLTTEFAVSRKELQKTSKDYEVLKTESKEFLQLQSKFKAASSKLAEQTKKAEKFEDELTKLLWNQNIKWFLSGAGVLILGFIIGFSAKRQRRRSSLL